MSAPLSFRLARARVRLSRSLRRRLLRPETTYVHDRVAEYRGYWEVAAASLGAEFISRTEEIWEVRLNGRRTRLFNFMTACDDPATRRLAGDKRYCYALASEVGLPVPQHVLIRPDDLAPAEAFFAAHPPPFVVKPARDTSSALGVTTGISTWSQFLQGAALASLFGNDILLERMIPGASCRLLYLDGRLIHAVRRSARKAPPERGRPVAELRTEYDEAVTHLCGERLISDCARMVAALGSEFAGIDLICNDLGRSLAESGGTFLEINTTPGIHHHYIGSDSHSANPVAKQVLSYLLRDPRGDGAHHGNG